MSPERTHRARILMGAGALALLAAVLFLFGLPATGPPPGSVGPNGTLALGRLLTKLGHHVVTGDAPATDEAYVLLTDRRGQRADDTILDWVSAGGMLILADPGSTMLPALGVSASDTIALHSGSGPITKLDADCLSAEAAGALAIEVRPSPLRCSAPGT